MLHTDTDELLDRIINALREAPVPKPLKPLSGRGTNQLPRRTSPADGDRAFTPRRMKKRWLTTGAAITLLMALVVTSSMLIPGTRPGAAFAEVQQAVTSIRSVRYRILDFHGDKDPYVTTSLFASGLGSRADGPAGSEQITNMKAQRMLWLDHRARKATIYQLYLQDGEQPGDKFHEKIRTLAANARPLGTRQLDGKRVLQFTFANQGEYVVLVDPETKLPLRMELKIGGAADDDTSFREVITDFIFDAPIDESTFEQKVPPEYAVERCEEPLDRKPIDTQVLAISPTRGIGHLPMGSSKDEVIAAFGKPDRIELLGGARGTSTAPGKPANKRHAEEVFEKLHYNSLGFELEVSSGQGITQFHCLPRGPLARPFLGKTDAGIRLGAPIDEVVQAYGAPEVRSHMRDEVLRYPHKGWSFVFDDSRLAWFSATEPLSELIEIEDHGDGSYTERVKEHK